MKIKATKRNLYTTPESLRPFFDQFFSETGHYPTIPEIDACPYFPSARFIQRTFGGLPALRTALNLPDTDYRTGPLRSLVARQANERAYLNEDLLYEYLRSLFGKMYVHRESYTGNDRNRADFNVFHSSGEFLVDVFYPSNRRSLLGCLNIKLKKYSISKNNPKVIFVEMNESISQEEKDLWLSRRKSSLPKNFYLMTVQEFKNFCNTLNTLC